MSITVRMFSVMEFISSGSASIITKMEWCCTEIIEQKNKFVSEWINK